MTTTADERESLLEAIRSAARSIGGERLTRQQFLRGSDFKLSDVFRHFPRWSAALRAAGFDFDPYNQRIPGDELLADWAQIARGLGRIPTRNEYKLEGTFSSTVFDRNFGAWTNIPHAFRAFAASKPEWTDVVELLPDVPEQPLLAAGDSDPSTSAVRASAVRNPRLLNRPTYGDPIDFRGLRHEPVNEDGVVFLFGMVARELGYLVEVVQAGFPDCEAKRQVAPGKWQRVLIEFEFESRNFREHGHDPGGCDIIVCWRHNWADCPSHLEIVELGKLIRSLPKSDE